MATNESPLAPIPLVTGGLIVTLEIVLRKLPSPGDAWCWVPFAFTMVIFILCFHGKTGELRYD